MADPKPMSDEEFEKQQAAVEAERQRRALAAHEEKIAPLKGLIDLVGKKKFTLAELIEGLRAERANVSETGVYVHMDAAVASLSALQQTVTALAQPPAAQPPTPVSPPAA